MPVIEESVFIARPPQAVFDFLAAPENIPVWDSSVVKAEQQGSGPVGPGSRARGTSKIVGRLFDWTVEVTEFDPPGRLTQKAVEGKMEFTVTNILQAAEGGTKYTYRIDAASGLGGIFGKLADPFIEMAQARTVRANLATLAEYLTHPAT
ncbi:SRPBCC family protein [Arthrobacter sp. RHLT1-20]